MTARAAGDGKPIDGLEELHEQLQFLDGLSIDAQRGMLMQALEESATLSETIDEMIRAWRYGDIEFHFDNWTVSRFFSDHGNLTDGGPTLKIDPWIVLRGLLRDAFEQHLKQQSIVFTVASAQYDPLQQHVATDSGVVFSFVGEPEEQQGPSGLIWWSTVASSPER